MTEELELILINILVPPILSMLPEKETHSYSYNSFTLTISFTLNHKYKFYWKTRICHLPPFSHSIWRQHNSVVIYWDVHSAEHVRTASIHSLHWNTIQGCISNNTISNQPLHFTPKKLLFQNWTIECALLGHHPMKMN